MSAWEWPQWTMAVWLLVQTMAMIGNDLGKLTLQSRATGLTATAIVQSTWIALMYAGGFWTP